MNALCGVCVIVVAMPTVLANVRFTERLTQETMFNCTALLEQQAVQKYVLAVTCIQLNQFFSLGDLFRPKTHGVNSEYGKAEQVENLLCFPLSAQLPLVAHGWWLSSPTCWAAITLR